MRLPKASTRWLLALPGRNSAHSISARSNICSSVLSSSIPRTCSIRHVSAPWASNIWVSDAAKKFSLVCTHAFSKILRLLFQPRRHLIGHAVAIMKDRSIPPCGACSSAVERRTVAPDDVGSNPTRHPNSTILSYLLGAELHLKNARRGTHVQLYEAACNFSP